MRLPLALDGSLRLQTPQGDLIQVVAEGPFLFVRLANWRCVLSILRNLPGRQQRRSQLLKLSTALAAHDLTVQASIATHTIATLAPESNAGVVSRLLGLGPVELQPIAILRAMFGSW